MHSPATRCGCAEGRVDVLDTALADMVQLQARHGAGAGSDPLGGHQQGPSACAHRDCFSPPWPPVGVVQSVPGREGARMRGLQGPIPSLPVQDPQSESSGAATELDFDTDGADVRLRDCFLSNTAAGRCRTKRHIEADIPSDYSLRAYLTILYDAPQFQMVLRDVVVSTRPPTPPCLCIASCGLCHAYAAPLQATSTVPRRGCCPHAGHLCAASSAAMHARGGASQDLLFHVNCRAPMLPKPPWRKQRCVQGHVNSQGPGWSASDPALTLPQSRLCLG